MARLLTRQKHKCTHREVTHIPRTRVQATPSASSQAGKGKGSSSFKQTVLKGSFEEPVLEKGSCAGRGYRKRSTEWEDTDREEEEL